MKEHFASLESEKQKSELTQVLAPANETWKYSLLIWGKEKVILDLGMGRKVNLH